MAMEVGGKEVKIEGDASCLKLDAEGVVGLV